MQRNLIIGGVAALVVAFLAFGAYFGFRAGGDDFALAQFDRVVNAYDGTYDSATFDTDDGRLIVEGLVLHNYLTDSEAEPLDLVEIDHLDASGLARFNLSDVLSGGRTQTIFSTLTATGITLTESGQVITVERFTARDVSLVSTDAFEPVPAGTQLTRREEVARLALLLHAGEMRISGFSSPSEGPTGMRLAEFAIDDMEAGTIGGIRASGLSLWDNGQMGTVGDTVRLDVGHVTLEGLDARVPLGRVARGEAVGFDRQSNVPLYDAFSADNISMQPERGDPLVIGAVSIANNEFQAAMPTDTTLSVSALRLPLVGDLMGPEEAASLRNLGYDELVLNFDYRAVFDFDTQEFELSDMALGIEDMGELHLQFRVGGVPFTEEMVDRSAEALLQDDFITALLEQAALEAGTLSFTDFGLYDRVVTANAEQAGQTREEYVQATIEGLRARRAEVASSETAVQTIDALISFFETPGTLTMTIAPDAPVPVQQLVLAMQINPLILVELLKLQVSAEN